MEGADGGQCLLIPEGQHLGRRRNPGRERRGDRRFPAKPGNELHRHGQDLAGEGLQGMRPFGRLLIRQLPVNRLLFLARLLTFGLEEDLADIPAGVGQSREIEA